MADYPAIDPRTFGTTHTVPTAVARLPVDLLRTALVTRQPALTQRAMEQYRQNVTAADYAAPMNLPQRMLFQQHKSNAGGIHRGDHRTALSSALSLSAAMRPTTVTGGRPGIHGLSAVSTLSLRVPEQVPTYSEAQAANSRGAQAFPVPEVNTAPEGIAARVRPLRQPIAPPLQAYGDALEENQQMRAAEQAFRTTQAMRSVATAREGIRKLLGF